MKNRPISDRILEVEKSINIDRFTYHGVNIWPVIRISMYLSSKGRSGKVRVDIWGKLHLIADGFVELFRLGFTKYTKETDILVLTSSHYKVTVAERKYDRIIHPFLDWMSEHAISYRVAEFGEQAGFTKHVYRKEIINIQPLFYLLSMFWRIQFYLKVPSFKDEDINSLNRLTKHYNIDFSINTNFKKRLYVLHKQSLLFGRYLRRLQVKKVMVVCYYDFKSLSLVWACHRIGIPTIDLQHGVQGVKHLAYAQWPNTIGNGSYFLPTHFWVWDRFSKENIDSWKVDHQNVILGCNKWVIDNVKKSTREVFLFTAQPIDDCIPDSLIEAIRSYSGKKKWYVRLHPHQISRLAEIEKIFRNEGIFEKVDIKNASLLPLTDVLSRTHMHITCFSSVAIEAFYFGIPTIFIDKRGVEMFDQILPDNMIVEGSDINSLGNILNGLESTDFIAREESLIDEMNRFSNISKFVFK